MAKLIIITMLIFSTSCSYDGKEKGSGLLKKIDSEEDIVDSNPEDVPEEVTEEDSPVEESPETEIPEVVTIPNLILKASRDYSPHAWEDYKSIVAISGKYKIPSEIQVVAGNSGQGWVSLIIGSHKFCYQGNSSGKNINDGFKFIMKYEKKNLTTSCSNKKESFNDELAVDAKIGDEIKLSVDGMDCGKYCFYTEIELILEVN